MRKTTLWIIGSLALVGLVYSSSPGLGNLLSGAGFWGWREEIMLAFGVMAFVFMTLAMVISVRPGWLDRTMGGLDKAYGLHKWAGICATIAAIAHWLAENGPKWIVSLGWMPHPGHLGGDIEPAPWERFLVESGGFVGEWAFYLLTILVVVALFQRIPYHWFRYAHRIFPVIYIALAYHAVAVLFKTSWWTTPAAYLILTLALAGTVASLVALTQRIGASRKVEAIVHGVDRHDNGIVDIELRVCGDGFSHQAGQFAFVRFGFGDEPHPFTIASSGDDPKRLRFAIKALGDFTNTLGEKIGEGQTVEVEGPYGQFGFDDAKGHQVWVAGGIGVTPFMARLEALAGRGGTSEPVDFWYCTKNDRDAAFPGQLDALCKKAGVVLHRVDAARKQYLSADTIRESVGDVSSVKVWFCGPQSFAESLLAGLVCLGFRDTAFHYDRFSMR